MNIRLFRTRLTLSRLVTLSEQHLSDGVITLDDKFSITKQQFDDLANDAMMNSKLNEFFAEGIRLMRDRNLEYSDLILVNLFLEKNKIIQVEIV